jgi:signal transduction histidine kinase
VKTIVEELGGRIDLESEPGTGTSFLVTFACREPEPAVATGTPPYARA